MRIVMLGDSLTQGYGLSPRQALPPVLEGLLRERGINATLVNHGISGDTAFDGLRRLPRALRDKPDLMVVEFGANDSFQMYAPEEVEHTLAAILTRLAEEGVPAVLVGIRILEELGMDYKAVFDPIFPRLAEQFNVPLVEDILDPYFGTPGMTLMDGLHPNAEGVRAIAAYLLPVVAKAVEPLQDTGDPA